MASNQDRVSIRSLADLARAGFSILRKPSMQVAYEVHHVHDRQGYLQDVLHGNYSRIFEPESDPTPPMFVETLTTAAHGVGLVVGVRAVSADPDGQRLGMGSGSITQADDPGKASRAFRSKADPNVSFVFDVARVFEGLISIEVEPTALLLRHGRAIRKVMEEIARIAVDIAEAPVLSVQSPVQLPPPDFNRADTEARTRPKTWPRAMSLAVRFAIAIPKPTSKLRLALADAFAEFCREHGFGLWLADSRSGYRAGNWFTICEHSTDTVRKLFDGALDPGNRSQAHACVPITLVGPARLDSLASLLDYLHSYHELGILACSMATIDDLAFIHLQLTINTEQVRLVQLNEAIDKLAAQSGSPPHVLPRLLARLVSRGVQDVGHEVKGRFAHRMGDYHLLTGPAIQVRPEVSPWRGALWVSWEVEGRDAELRYPFLALHDALARNPLWADSNVEYLICRKVRNSVLRGKGKLSFPADIATNNFGYEDIPSGLSAFSESIENAWRAELGERHRVRELTVSWREYWLGHWTSPLD